MKTMARCVLMLLVSSTISGCISLANRRDDSFRHIKEPPRILLLLVGGNSECSGRNGLWPIRDKIADDLAIHLGLDPRALSTDYVAWTGDPADDSGCLPSNTQYLSGHLAISRRLAAYGPLADNRLFVVVGWSNGGATATQLSEYLHKVTNTMPVNLLVTLDPVSRLTDRPKDSMAKTWLNVYTASSGSDKLRRDNIIAALGGAWDYFQGPALVACMEGNHGDAEQMWRAVILPSKQFQEWAKHARERLGTTAPKDTAIPKETFESCQSAGA